jgi:hypothetical protein
MIIENIVVVALMNRPTMEKCTPLASSFSLDPRPVHHAGYESMNHYLSRRHFFLGALF